MTSSQLTIITEPITFHQKIRSFIFSLKQRIKFLLSYVLDRPFWRIYTKPTYSGHYAVTRSIVEGLLASSTSFNYNPKKKKDIAKTVFVPGGHSALLYALDLKKRGDIDCLVAGPNIAVFPSEITSLPTATLIDIYLQPSMWVIDLWHTIMPVFPIPLKVWAAGVDTTFWTPSSKEKNKKHIILYKKHVPENFFLSIKNTLEEAGYVIEVIMYGSYTAEQYRDALHRNASLVHLTESESQGISLAEAWAADVPTFVWNPQKIRYKDIVYTESSSAPYLTSETGSFFKTPQELLHVLSTQNCSPRTWCVEHMTDKVCAEKLLLIINSVCGKK